MTEFKNILILKEETYKNGLFPQIPNYRKEGSIFILTEGIDSDLVVDQYTTSRQIRQGRYARLVEISSKPHYLNVHFESQSQESGYSFDVEVKAVIQVTSPLVFYANRNVDVDSYFQSLFMLDVRKITEKYSILDYAGMDNELTTRLSQYNDRDDSTGCTYRISIVDAKPGKKAREYVEKDSQQRLDMKMRQSAQKLTESLSPDLVTAIRAEVVEGKLTEVEAFEKMWEMANKFADKETDRAKLLRDEGFLTEMEVREFVKNRAIPTTSVTGLPGTGIRQEMPPGEEEVTSDVKEKIDALYRDAEDKANE